MMIGVINDDFLEDGVIIGILEIYFIFAIPQQQIEA